MGAFQFEWINCLQLVSEHKLKTMSLIFLVPLSALICTVIGDLAEPCRNTGDRYFVSDSQQCDRFHMCDENGALAAEFLCEDGLVFDTISNCPRQNGKWAVDETCNQYIDCTNGIERLVTCQNHLVFDDSTGDCEHPDAANRDGCTAEGLYGFSCPTGVSQSRHAAESDCRAFFTCAVYTNYHPRLGGCPVGTVYNPDRQICDEPENVPSCKNYYES